MELSLFLFWFGIAFVTGVAASARGRNGFGWFLLGLVFSPLALIAVLVLPKLDPNAPTPETHLRCPDCKELVLKEARVCKHCGCKLIPQ
jgi:hypothetical protein